MESRAHTPCLLFDILLVLFSAYTHSGRGKVRGRVLGKMIKQKKITTDKIYNLKARYHNVEMDKRTRPTTYIHIHNNQNADTNREFLCNIHTQTQARFNNKLLMMRFLKLNEMEINKEIHLVSRLVWVFSVGLFSPIFCLSFSFCFLIRSICIRHYYLSISTRERKKKFTTTKWFIVNVFGFGVFFTVRVLFICVCVRVSECLDEWACFFSSSCKYKTKIISIM